MKGPFAAGFSPGAGSAGLLTPVVDDTDTLVRGGRGVYSHPTPVSLDPHYTGGQVPHGWHEYQQLFRIKEGHMGPSPGEIEGALAKGPRRGAKPAEGAAEDEALVEEAA